MKTKLFESTAVVLLIALFIALPLCVCWVFPSAMEAAAYNRVTGSHVTTWDAMWIKLIVTK